MLKPLYIILGSICLILGTIGIFLPILPTTPFYLLTAFFYFRSSERLYNKVMSYPVFSSIVKDYQEHRIIPRRAKVISISIMLLSMGFSIYLIKILWVKVLLAVIGIAVSLFIIRHKEVVED